MLGACITDLQLTYHVQFIIIRCSYYDCMRFSYNNIIIEYQFLCELDHPGLCPSFWIRKVGNLWGGGGGTMIGAGLISRLFGAMEPRTGLLEGGLRCSFIAVIIEHGLNHKSHFRTDNTASTKEARTWFACQTLNSQHSGVYCIRSPAWPGAGDATVLLRLRLLHSTKSFISGMIRIHA